MSLPPSIADVLSGRRRGWRAGLLRATLALAEPIYRTGVGWRNRGYDLGRKPIHRVSVPVISVGNLTTGGTGKTPLVASMARSLAEQGRNVGLVSRGYGAKPGRPNDEALELAILLPDVPHFQDPDRVAAARRAISERKCDVLILDDAFQHRRLHRDLDIVLIDALAPFGFEHLLPRGLLREPIENLRRARVAALSRADLVSDEERASIVSRIRETAPSIEMIEMSHRAERLLDHDGSQTELDQLRGARIAAFCGIGNPLAFQKTLAACGAEIACFRGFPDHFRYGASDIETLSKWIASQNVERVICTLKDLVKVRATSLGGVPLHALQIGIEFRSGRDKLESAMREMLDAPR